MTELEDPDAVLAEARTALSGSRSVYEGKLNWRLHNLAEAQDEKAKVFFAEVMQNARDDDWRLEMLRDVGFHYDLSDDPAIVRQIREMLLSDPDDDVRSAAAMILGIRSSWPDQALYRAMLNDVDKTNRVRAFESLLRLSGMSYKEYTRAYAQAKTGEIPITPESLKALVGDKFSELVQDE